jgi:hypothetical protein
VLATTADEALNAGESERGEGSNRNPSSQTLHFGKRSYRTYFSEVLIAMDIVQALERAGARATMTTTDDGLSAAIMDMRSATVTVPSFVRG